MTENNKNGEASIFDMPQLINIIVARKGGTGKTLVALTQLSYLLSFSVMEKNIMLIDINDMNPDAFTITKNILDSLKEADILEIESKKIYDAPPIIEMIVYRIKREDKIAKNLVIVRLSTEVAQNVFFSHRLNSSDTISQLIHIFSDKRIWESLKKEGIDHIDYTVVDTNTSFATLLFDSRFLSPRNYPFWSIIRKNLSEYLDKTTINTVETDSGMEIMESSVRLLKEALRVTYVLPLSSLLDDRLLEIEFNSLKYFSKSLFKENTDELKMMLVINSYAPIYTKTGLAERLKGLFRNEKYSAILEKKEYIELLDKNLLELIDIQGNEILLGLDGLHELLKPYAKTISKLMATGNVIKRRENMAIVLIKLAFELEKYSRTVGKDIANMAVYPFYDDMIGLLTEEFRGGIGVKDAVKNLKKWSKDAIRNQIYDLGPILMTFNAWLDMIEDVVKTMREEFRKELTKFKSIYKLNAVDISVLEDLEKTRIFDLIIEKTKKFFSA